MQIIKPHVQEMDISPYPFAKIGLDVSGPYPNTYVISFVDWYSGWPEAFPVSDKSADTIAQLLIDEILPRHGIPLWIVTDNGSENVNKVIGEMLAELNIHHVVTSFYHPQGNANCERFHRTLKNLI
jgi:transposase InsO family protein